MKTLQMFITTKCNLRCKDCFYQNYLSKFDMSFEEYVKYVDIGKKNGCEKITLLGGEPLLHKDLYNMIMYNSEKQLKTTIYTNGSFIGNFDTTFIDNCTIRIGILGLNNGEKKLADIKKVDFPVTIVYMLRKDNIYELLEASKYAEDNFNCNDFFISSIRDICVTNDFWKDTEDTIPNKQYIYIVRDFLNNYKGGMNIHVASKGMFGELMYKCRFWNVLTNGKQIQCPLDISMDKYTDEEMFTEHCCDKGTVCVLQKNVFNLNYNK